MLRPPRRAFTLIELLVVIVILVAIVLPAVALIAAILVALLTSAAKARAAHQSKSPPVHTADEPAAPARPEEDAD